MKRDKFDIFSVLWTILVHAFVIGLLFLLHLTKPVAQAESGVPVMLGNMGNLDTDYEFTEVNSMPAPAPAAVPTPRAPQAEPAITQNLEETVAIESGEKEKPVKPTETPKQPTPEELQAQREREVHEQTETQVLDVFARSRNMQASSSTTENNSEIKGDLGSSDGNTTQGSIVGVGGVGPHPDLAGRTAVGLFTPSNANIPEEAMVVVNIRVDANGNVTNATINKRTKTMNKLLRDRSIDAARRTKFNAIPANPESEDATGTITYFYKLN